MAIKKDILITGSVAIDTIKTPMGEAKDILGGSATYASFSASLFVPVKIISIVGSDFPGEYLEKFKSRGIDISGLKISPGQTFRWTGMYRDSMNEAHTLSVCPENLKDASMNIPSNCKNSGFIFLANTDPEIQAEILRNVKSSGPVMLDTMNLWIKNKPESLKKLLPSINIMVINETESRMFTGKTNLISAGKEISKMGPKTVIIKKGEHGALFLHNDDIFYIPAYPLEQVKDPTGAGDSFAGGMMGYLASSKKIDVRTLCKSAMAGTATASFTVEGFGTSKLESIEKTDIEQRMDRLRKLVKY